MVESTARPLGDEGSDKYSKRASFRRQWRDGVRRTAEMGKKVATAPVLVPVYVAETVEGGRRVFDEHVAPVIDIISGRKLDLKTVYPEDRYARIVLVADRTGQPVEYIRTIDGKSQTEKDTSEAKKSKVLVTYYPHGLPDNENVSDEGAEPDDMFNKVVGYYKKLTSNDEDTYNRFLLTKVKEPEKMVRRIMCRKDTAVLVAQDIQDRHVVGTAVVYSDPNTGNSDFGFDTLREERKKGLARALQRDAMGIARERGIEEVDLEIYGGNHGCIRTITSSNKISEMPWMTTITGRDGSTVFGKFVYEPPKTSGKKVI